jgi:hypothetical protein
LARPHAYRGRSMRKICALQQLKFKNFAAGI